MKVAFGLALCLASGIAAFGQRSTAFIPIPQVYRTPEYGWTGGFALFYLQKVDSLKGRFRPSYYEAGAYLSEFGFYGSRLSWQSFGKKDGYFTKGEATLGKNHLNYFGQEGTRNAPIGYYSVSFKMSGQWLWKYRKHLYAGPRMVVEKWRQVGDNLPNTATGSSGFSAYGLGAGILYDNRNNAIRPSSGWVGEWHVVEHLTTTNNLTLFGRLVADVSWYRSFQRFVYAGNAYASVQWGNAIPFDLINVLGNSRRLRGYYEGYYRERQMALLQQEARVSLWGRLGMVCFASAGWVGTSSINPVFSAGGGLRFTADRKSKLVLRLDVAAGPGSWGYYAGVGEAF